MDGSVRRSAGSSVSSKASRRSRDSSRFLTIPVSQEDLSTAIRVDRLALRRGSDHPAERLWQDSGRRLYQQLVEPLSSQGWLEPDDHLLLAPHQHLWAVPVHALPLPSGEAEPRFLIERNVVSYVPSATDLVEQRRRSPRPVRSMLAVAPETVDLPHTKPEIELLRRTSFDRTQILQDAKAQRLAVQRAWSEVDLLHLAAHAQTNERFPLYSALQLRNGRIELHEILQDSLQARLVVLSACETGQAASSTGEVPTGASAVSFPRAFLSAGPAASLGRSGGWRMGPPRDSCGIFTSRWPPCRPHRCEAPLFLLGLDRSLRSPRRSRERSAPIWSKAAGPRRRSIPSTGPALS